MMHLAEHDWAGLAGRGPPLPDATLERAALVLGKLPGMLSLKPVEQRFGQEAGLRFQPGLNALP